MDRPKLPENELVVKERGFVTRVMPFLSQNGSPQAARKWAENIARSRWIWGLGFSWKCTRNASDQVQNPTAAATSHAPRT